MQPPNAPNPDYQFILNDAQGPKKSLLPSGRRGIFFGLGILITVLLIILLYGIFTSGKGSSGAAALTDVVGKSKEISRISQAQMPNLKDPSTTALAATAGTTMNSDSTQISNYLAKHKVKVDGKKLALYQANDQSVDAQLSQAAANNNLDTAYASYLRNALNDYSQAIKTAYAASSSQTAKSLLQQSFDSTQTLLSSPLLKS